MLRASQKMVLGTEDEGIERIMNMNVETLGVLV